MKNKIIELISKQIEELIEETYKDGVKAGQEKALTANSENVEKITKTNDKIMKVNIYLMRKYLDELEKEFEDEFHQKFSVDGIPQEILDDNFVKIMRINMIFDKIAEHMNNEMPLPWYEYGFCGDTIIGGN